ncbi:mechanosensitive ion channel family protein [Dyadobacter sp. Leaf189]|uniref:mechanosensitive ion channel family protein n=1 Tax=Dyadobacter sp. Leaf189 TaxID=1736295 RepID=UPI0006F415D2|nr:mechanosensitive ion channel family protein [Dyadobacter sp. Leaf189]KQS27648.1 mechanosensitive ion channel protein MscS [Dyadobacter sp. Leaf189]
MSITIHSDFLPITFSNEARRLFKKGSVLRIFILSIFLGLTGSNLHAQLPATTQDTTKAGKSEVTYPPDSLGRRTPRGAVDGFLRAASQNNFKKAALYLRRDPALKKKQDRTRQAKALNALVEAKGSIYPYSWISNDYEGKTDDELGPNLDRIGAVEVNNESVELILESTKDASGGPIWLFSTQTIERIPLDSAQIASSSLLSKLSPKILIENDWGGVPIAHWVAMLLLIILSFVAASLLARLFLRTIPLVYRKAGEEPISGVLKAFSLPARLYLAVLLFVSLSREAGISIVVRQWFSNLTLIVGLAAALLLIWELVDVATRITERRMARRRNQAAVSAILFSRRALKIAIVVGGILLVLDTFGFDVSTGLAALGIGGIALALGTQKTVENFIGSVTIIADQPIRVGDFCKIGDIAGTIEQIGMRATRVRTNDRTVVSIPNGDLSSLKIENLAYREKFWFHPVFNLRMETTPDQLRYLLVELRAILYAHPKVNSSPARVRLIEVGATSFKIEVFAYINTIDNDDFLEIQEDLLLRMMELVTKSGTSFALPSQTVYLAQDQGYSPEEAAKASEQVKQWQESGELSIPSFSKEKVSTLKDTISYPPEGSSKRKEML